MDIDWGEMETFEEWLAYLGLTIFDITNEEFDKLYDDYLWEMDVIYNK